MRLLIKPRQRRALAGRRLRGKVRVAVAAAEGPKTVKRVAVKGRVSE